MRAHTQQTYQERILRVLVHIQKHLDESLCLEDLAAVACFSPYHFHRIFSGMVGESVKEHVRRLRLERAAHRLKHGDQPVTMIAFDAGYETHEAFTRAFRAMFGQPPSEFREARRLATAPTAGSGVYYMAEGVPSHFEPVETGGHPMEVRMERVEPTRVAFIRHVGPYMEVGRTWEKLFAWVGRNGLFGPDTRVLGLCHDDPEVTPPDKIRYDACVAVRDGVEPDGEVGVQIVGDGEYAVTTHVGPYEKLGQTYAGLCGQWLPGSGRELRSAPCLEMYLNSPQSTPPDQLRTDIYMPLAPGA